MKKLWRSAWATIAAACLMVGGIVPIQEANTSVGVNFRAEVHDATTGQVLHAEEKHNLVVTAGLNLLKVAMATGTCAFPAYFGLGTSTTAAAAGQTDLVAPSFRAALTSSVQDAAQPILTCQYYLPSATGNGVTYNEAGLFTAAAAGTMYARVVLATPIIKTIAVAVSFVWTLTWAAI